MPYQRYLTVAAIALATTLPLGCTVVPSSSESTTTGSTPSGTSDSGGDGIGGFLFATLAVVGSIFLADDDDCDDCECECEDDKKNGIHISFN